MGFNPAEIFRSCPWCGLRDAQMQHLTTHEVSRIGSGPRWWAILSCPRCGGIISIEVSSPQEGDIVLTVVPEEGAHVGVEHLPDDVRKYYNDAIRVLDAGVPDAAAVQLRRTLEAAAAHHEVKSGPLVQRIKKLIDAGKITSEFGDVLDHIRVVGNVGAHAGDTVVDEVTARRALRFTTQVLRNLFEIPAELKAIAPNKNEEQQAGE
jgi:hypothetical protein